MGMTLPFSLLPPKVLQQFSKQFYTLAGSLTPLFSSLKEDLEQAESSQTPREYLAQAFASALLDATVILTALLTIGFLAKMDITLFALGMFFVVGLAAFFTAASYPRITASRRARALERQLVPALRQLLIQLKSGVPLFNGMASLTNDYEEVSVEFRKIVRRINAGTSELDALSDASQQNPSLSFRRVLWQLTNALKVGSDVSRVVEGLVDELMGEQKNQIRRYGQELSPWAMLYMMLAVVVPSLGVTMMLVVASFAKFSIPIIVLAGVIGGLILFQLFFMSFISSRRPSV